jgi:Flp pilus assembly protein TadG
MPATARRRGSRYLISTQGTTAVEFALVAPVFILLISACLGYGLIFFTSVSLHQLGADVTRATIGGLDLAEKRSLAESHLTNSSREYALIDDDMVSIDVQYDASTQSTVVLITYDSTGHPIEIFEGILPMPAKVFQVRQVISENRE